MDVLIIGCGSIGSMLAKSLDSMEGIGEVLLTDKGRDQARLLASQMIRGRYIGSDDKEIQSAISHVDLVIEAASQEAAWTYAPIVLGLGVDLMMMSVGALTDDRFRQTIMELAKKRGGRLMVPSGAVSGTDGLHAAAMGEVDEVRLTTIKAPRSLRGNPALIEHGIDVDSLRTATVVFEGTAREAAKLFPISLNVAATLSLLGVGFEDTKVIIVCDPETERNTHLLEVRGPFGEIRAETQNVPSPSNPSTSFLAALSAVATVRRLLDNVWIGI